MSDLEKKIQSDLVDSMKARDELRLSTLRMLKSEIQKAKTAKGASSDLSDEDVVALVQRSIKQRREAAEQYLSGGASERAQQELDEADVLSVYLPEQLSPEELDSLIASVADEIHPKGPSDMGRLMGRIMPAVKGKADGGLVRQKVSDFLKNIS